MAEQRREVTDEVRRQRHESRTGQTFWAFIRDVCEETGLPSEDAVRATHSVLCRLEQRLTPEEAADFGAQLPFKIRELLNECPLPEDTGSIEKIHRETFVARVADDLGVTPEQAESTIRSVFLTVRSHISEGEAGDVEAQLPKDLEALWARPA